MSRRPARSGPEAGFSLVELMISLVLLAVALLGMASVLIGTSRWQGRTESHLELMAAGEGKLEDLRTVARSWSADSLQLAPGGSLTANQSYHADSIQSAEGRWILRRWEVTSGPSSARTVNLRVLTMDDTDRTVDQRDFATIILPTP